MSGRDGADPARRQQLENGNAALRGQIDTMLSDLRRRTREMQDRQAETAQKTYEVTSEDGMVTAKVDATGTLQHLELSPKAFERSAPDRLARTITSVIREASGSAQQSLQADFAGLADAPDLPSIFDGAPSFQDFLSNGPLVTPPDPATERAQRNGAEPPPPPPQPSTPPSAQQGEAPRRDRDQPDDDFDDDPPESFMAGGRW